MKYLYLSLLSVFVLFSFNAVSQTDDGDVEIIYPTKFIKTIPLRDMIPVEIDENLSNEPKKEMNDRKLRVPFSEKLNPDALPKGEDPAAQKIMGTNSLGAPLESWNGQNGNGTPPDPTGAAGPDHYVQAVNSYYKIYTKTGAYVTGGGPYTLGSLLFGSNSGDPIVMYDKFAERWVITEFGSYTNRKIYIAVSETSDPTGSYYTYEYTSPQFPDYLKFSIWTDGYYMTSNQTTQRVFVFEREAMLNGDASPKGMYTNYSPPKSSGFFCPLAGFADGQLPPVGTPCPIFSYEDDGWGSSYNDAINIYEMSVDWVAETATITFKQELLTDAFDASYNSSWNDITQPGTSAKLDGIGGVFTYRAQHTVWSNYNAVVLNMGVKVNSTTRSIRWYEIRQDHASGVWSVHQQGTYAPDAHSRWCGSIAMDVHGGIGLAYAKSSSSVYPSICYTARNNYDPLNQMTYTEETAAAGSGVQTFTNRFGDYTHTTIDPVDQTIFWHTGEYFISGYQRTKIFSFRIPYNASIDEYGNAEITAYDEGDFIVVKGDLLSGNDELIVDLFDINGRLLKAQMVNPISGKFESRFSVTELPTGIYLIRVGKNNTSFQRVIKVPVN